MKRKGWNSMPDDGRPYEEVYCIGCSGSGEGMHEGAVCATCGGSGTEYAPIETTEEDEDHAD